VFTLLTNIHIVLYNNVLQQWQWLLKCLINRKKRMTQVCPWTKRTKTCLVNVCVFC